MTYDEIKIGDHAEITHSVSQQDVEKFVALTGDDNRLHLDKEFAAQTTLKTPVAHGMIGASFISTVIGTKMPGDGSLWMTQELNFVKPVRVGDTLTIRAEVTKKYDRDRIVELATTVLNQFNEPCTTGRATVKVIDRQAPASSPVPSTEVKGTVLVVGATGGIGEATCLALARNGYDLVVHFHSNEEKALGLCNRIRDLGRNAFYVRADVSDPEAVSQLAKSLQRRVDDFLGFVYCPTSRLPTLPALSLRWEDVQTQIDTSVKGFLLVFSALAPLLCQRKYGKIVVLSTQAVDKPTPKWGHYVAAKAGLAGLAKCLAIELAPLGVRINLVSPGMVDTPLIADTPQKARLLVQASTPLKRLATPEDVAAAICFLMSSGSDFLAGETLRVNGGQVMI